MSTLFAENAFQYRYYDVPMTKDGNEFTLRALEFVGIFEKDGVEATVRRYAFKQMKTFVN